MLSGKEANSHLATTSFQVERDKDSPESPLLQIEQSQFPQPLLLRPVFQIRLEFHGWEAFLHSRSNSLVAGESPAGVTEEETLGIAPWNCSTEIQDPFQHLANPVSNWSSITENSAGCRVSISACSISMTLSPSALIERHIAAIPPPASLYFWHIPSIWHLATCCLCFIHILPLAKVSWKWCVGWSGRTHARDLLGCHSYAMDGRDMWAASITAADSTTVPQSIGSGLKTAGRGKYWSSAKQSFPLIPGPCSCISSPPSWSPQTTWLHLMLLGKQQGYGERSGGQSAASRPGALSTRKTWIWGSNPE